MKLSPYSFNQTFLQHVVSVSNGAGGSIREVSVSDLTGVESVFTTSGEGTLLEAENINIFNISVPDPDPGWVVFEAEESSTMSVSDSSISEVTGVTDIFVARTAASMTVTSTNVTTSSGDPVSL